MKRQVSRREFLRMAAVSAAGTVMAACGAQAPATPGAPAGEATAAPAAGGAAGGSESGTLTVWGWEGTYEGVESQVKPFEEKSPNVKVDVKKFGYEDTHTNLLNAIVAGTGAPDLCAIDVVRLTQYVDGLTDLSAEASQYKEQFVRPTYSVGSYKGKFYGLATDSEPMGMFYRKDLWDQYGLKESDINVWSDLAAASEKIADASGGKAHLYMMGAKDIDVFQMMALQQGFAGWYFNEDDTKVVVDDPKMIEAVPLLKQMWDAKGVRQNPTGDEPTVLLKNGTVITQIVGPAWYPLTLTGQMPELKGKWRLMRAPAVKAGGPRIGYQVPTILVILQQTKLKSSAWELARVSLLGEGARALYEKTHILPAYKPLLDELKTKGDEYFGGQNIAQLSEEIANDCPDVFFGTGFVEAQQIMGNHLEAILTGQKEVAQGLKDAAQEIRAKLNKG